MKVAFDFETKAIDEFPNYPPKPVSLALSTEHGEDVYFAWGHPTNNNCTEEEAKAALRAYWDDPSTELVAHNLSFDLCVAAVHWGFSLEPAATMHDTMVMAFLLDPYAYTYALKPSAEKHLGLPPEERDAIQDWLIANGVPGATNKDWGGLICEAPGDIVGVYAMGDTRRTLRLFNEIYWPQIQASGMQDAYRREIDLIPVMLENTIEGIAVDIPRLTQDVQLYEKALADIGQFLFQQLNCEPFNVDSDAQLADAIDRVYPGLEWVLTPKGKRSTSKANLEITLSSVGGLLGATLQYRASIATCLNTFMKPWLKQAVNGDGRIRCQWNTTRSDTAGARTGRLSSKPNFQNIPTLESAKFKQALKAFSAYLEALGYPPLPNVRCYVVADDENSVLLDRDFSGQELRVMAHFEDGQALQAYKENPFLDLHQWAADFINDNLGLNITRKQTKTCSFAILYGSGLTTLAAQMGGTTDEAARVKGAYLDALPGLQDLINGLKSRARQNLPFRTWGGRLYYCEPAKFVDGRWRSYDYKMVNYLIQGSSADITKEALIRYHHNRKHGRIILCVHDEICVSCPIEHYKTEMEILHACMEGVELDAKLVSDGKIGRNWHELVPADTYGVVHESA